MAVQQNKPTRSKRGMRRSHDALTAVTSLSVDKTSGEKHLRHHITADGYYRGRPVWSFPSCLGKILTKLHHADA